MTVTMDKHTMTKHSEENENNRQISTALFSPYFLHPVQITPIIREKKRIFALRSSAFSVISTIFLTPLITCFLFASFYRSNSSLGKRERYYRLIFNTG